ncbi:MAG: alanine racemase [Planctomycetota bacterium]|nr:alanine racemase [Planctomycetota bacterium]
MNNPWPHRRDIWDVSFLTPLPAVRLARLRQVATEQAISHASQNLAWRPANAEPILAEGTAVVRQSGAIGFSSHRLEAVEAIAGCGEEAVTLTLPPVVGEGPKRLAELARQAQVTVACDHFAQVERLADACQAVGSSINVLINIDVGRQRVGVRPGPDLSDFLQGLAGLRHIHLAGLSIANNEIFDSGVGRLNQDEVQRVLRACRRALRQVDWGSMLLSVACPGAFPDSGFRAVEARTPLSSSSDSPFAVVAGVIGRPTRDIAVIDAGVQEFRDATIAQNVPDGIHLEKMGDNFAVLKLGGVSQDLMIGDLVAFEIRALSSLRPASSVLINENGRWRVASPGAWR